MAQIAATVRIATDPEVRFTKGQDPKAILSFRAAESHRRKNHQTGEWEDSGTTWRNVSLFGAKAEHLADTLHKGDLVVIHGREQTRAFTRQDGTTGDSLDLVADDIGLVSRPTGQSQQPQRPAQQQQPAADPWGGGQQQSYDWSQDQDQAPPF